MKKVTMQSIANELGITKMSVSKCFQNSSDISAELSRKIMETADAMGYVYKKATQYKIIILLAERFLDPSDKFYSGIIQRLNQMAEDYQMEFSLSIVKHADDENGRISNEIGHYDGVVLLGQVSRGYVEAIRQFNIPAICIDFQYRNMELDAVVSNSYSASYHITSYLLEHGHRRVAFVGNLNSTNSINDRYLGYCKALMEARIENPKDYRLDDMDEQGNHIEISLPKELPTAFVCNNDYCAYLLIKQLQMKGYQVPEDVSVVGFDDVLYAAVSNPEITTMRVPIESMASRAVKQLAKRLKEPERAVSVSNIECCMIERASVADAK